MDPVDPLTRLLLLADARLPVAGHTQSGNLEPALRDGLAVSDVPAYLTTRLRTVTRVEAATAVVTLHRLRGGEPLDEVVTAWAARTPSPAMRANSVTMGAAQLRLARSLWPGAGGLRAVAGLSAVPRPVAVGVIADAAVLPPGALARLVGYDDVQTVAAAALKLCPLDPAETTRWVLGALPEIERLAAAVAGLTDPEDIPAAGAPQIEAWAEAHARQTRRLFSA